MMKRPFSPSHHPPCSDSPARPLPDSSSPWPRWLSLAAAAKYASMCKATLRGYIETGEIYGTLNGGKWYVDRESIDAFFLGQQVRIGAIVTRILGDLR